MRNAFCSNLYCYCGWTKSISHQFETNCNHCLLVFTGESSFQGFLGGAKWISSIHSIWVFLLPQNSGSYSVSCSKLTFRPFGFPNFSNVSPYFVMAPKGDHLSVPDPLGHRVGFQSLFFLQERASPQLNHVLKTETRGLMIRLGHSPCHKLRRSALVPEAWFWDCDHSTVF